MLTLIVVRPDNYLAQIKDLIDDSTVVINFSRFFEEIQHINDKAKIIDAISYIYPIKAEGIIPVSDPSNLTEISIEILKLNAKKIVIDSLTTMLFYNSPREVISMLESLKKTADVYLISINRNEEILEDLNHLIDKVLPLSSSG